MFSFLLVITTKLCLFYLSQKLHGIHFFHGQASANVAIEALGQVLNCSKKEPGYFTMISDRAPPAARGRSGSARV